MAAACTERLAIDTTDGSGETTVSTAEAITTSQSTDSTTDPTTSAPGTTDAQGTTDAPVTTEAVTSTGPDSDTTTGTESGSSGETSESSTGGPSVCGPPCAQTWTHLGDLVIWPGAPTAEYECMDFVAGTLEITGNFDAAALAPLRNLRFTSGLRIEYNDALTDLSSFECLEEATNNLVLYQVPALTDASALGKLRSASYVQIEQTALTGLPAFAPDFTGVENVYIRDNPAIVGISAMAGWGHLPGDYLAIQLDDNPVLTSLVGIEGPIAAAGDATVAVQVTKAPKLASLAGLEAMTHGSLWLQALPKVPDLLPLEALTEGDNITLFGMPAVKTLQGLHNLVTTDWLMIGDCMSGKPGSPGMDGLIDLSGLDSLTTAWSLSIANNANLGSLTGAPVLTMVNGLEAIENPKLTPAKVEEFVMTLAGMPDACVGGFDQCQCFEILPW